MNGRHCQKRVETCGNTLPPDDQTAILFLQPGEGALGLEARHHFFDWTAPVFLGLPDALGNLRPDATLPELLTYGFRIVPFIGGDDVETFTRTTSCARPHLDRIEQGHHLGTLIPIGRGGAMRQGHAIPRRQTMDEHSLAFAATSHALTPTFPRGKKRHQRRHTPSESCRVPRPAPAPGPASPPGCHRPASAATTDGRHSSWPSAALWAYRTSDSR